MENMKDIKYIKHIKYINDKKIHGKRWKNMKLRKNKWSGALHSKCGEILYKNYSHYSGLIKTNSLICNLFVI